jgi:hypothetical protein
MVCLKLSELITYSDQGILEVTSTLFGNVYDLILPSFYEDVRLTAYQAADTVAIRFTKHLIEHTFPWSSAWPQSNKR